MSRYISQWLPFTTVGDRTYRYGVYRCSPGVRTLKDIAHTRQGCTMTVFLWKRPTRSCKSRRSKTLANHPFRVLWNMTCTFEPADNTWQLHTSTTPVSPLESIIAHTLETHRLGRFDAALRMNSEHLTRHSCMRIRHDRHYIRRCIDCPDYSHRDYIHHRCHTHRCLLAQTAYRTRRRHCRWCSMWLTRRWSRCPCAGGHRARRRRRRRCLSDLRNVNVDKIKMPRCTKSYSELIYYISRRCLNSVMCLARQSRGCTTSNEQNNKLRICIATAFSIVLLATATLRLSTSKFAVTGVAWDNNASTRRHSQGWSAVFVFTLNCQSQARIRIKITLKLSLARHRRLKRHKAHRARDGWWWWVTKTWLRSVTSSTVLTLKVLEKGSSTVKVTPHVLSSRIVRNSVDVVHTSSCVFTLYITSCECCVLTRPSSRIQYA